MIEVINRQRSLAVEKEYWKRFAERALKKITADNHNQGVTIVFVSDRAIRKLHREFRNVDKATDVLSFPFAASALEKELNTELGDVVISVERACHQASANGLSAENEIAQLVLHGLLHLCGYDHEKDRGEMNRLEIRLRRELGI